MKIFVSLPVESTWPEIPVRSTVSSSLTARIEMERKTSFAPVSTRRTFSEFPCMAFKWHSLIDSMRERNDERKTLSFLSLCLLSFLLFRVFFRANERNCGRENDNNNYQAEIFSSHRRKTLQIRNQMYLCSSQLSTGLRRIYLLRRSVLSAMYLRRRSSHWNCRKRKTKGTEWKNCSAWMLSVDGAVAKRAETKIKWNLIFLPHQIDGHELEFEETDSQHDVCFLSSNFLDRLLSGGCRHTSRPLQRETPAFCWWKWICLWGGESAIDTHEKVFIWSFISLHSGNNNERGKTWLPMTFNQNDLQTKDQPTIIRRIRFPWENNAESIG